MVSFKLIPLLIGQFYTSFILVWVTMNNIRVPEDPFFFCAYCYKQFNFVDRKRVGSFREFRFFDVNVM